MTDNFKNKYPEFGSVLDDVYLFFHAIKDNHDVFKYMVEDLETFLSLDNNKLPRVIVHAWCSTFIKRIKSIINLNVNPVNEITASDLNKLRTLSLELLSKTKATSFRLFFGQMSVNYHFAGEIIQQSEQQKRHCDKDINTVGADDLFHGHVWEISIFFHENKWIAANNRGLVVHCMNNIVPLRLKPRLPTPDELNRLNEIEGGTGQDGKTILLKYSTEFAHENKLIVHKITPKEKRKLPSNQVPIKKDDEIILVVTVPERFAY